MSTRALAVVAVVAVATTWCAAWLATYRLHGPWLDGGAVGYARLGLAVGIGLVLPRPWTPLLALAVPLAALGLPSDREAVAGLLAGTAVAAGLIVAGVSARCAADRMVASARDAGRARKGGPSDDLN